MQFKYPEILYALLLLIIPILVHLFQLQRFVKVPFTNVKFLKNIVQQTRKSSHIQKLLILATRMLAFTCLILAFSQPYFSNFSTQQNFNTNIYIDNSFSMQAKGAQGELFKSIAQDIVENSNALNGSVSLLTNNSNLKDLDLSNLKNELINSHYSPNKLDLETVLLQLNIYKNTKSNSLCKNILISDFQNINITNKSIFTNVNSTYKLLKVSPKQQNNIFIDSVFIQSANSEEIVINATIKSVEKTDINTAVSLFENTKLIGKTTAKFNNDNQVIVQFSIPNSTNFNGKITLNDEVLTFDNDFFFIISKPAKINILSVGNNSDFLTKIYTENEFNFNIIPLQNLKYSELQNQELIILNELDFIPKELSEKLLEFLSNGGDLVIIPAEKSDLISYNQCLNLLKIGNISTKIENKHSVTTINYNHPLIQDVFEKKVLNFQYPTLNTYFKTTLNSASSILTLDNNEPFIASINTKNSNVYWIASNLKKENSNFIQSPLVVPIFYNFAKNSLKINQLYYTIHPNTTFDIKTTIGIDEVLKISNGISTFIPLQKVAQNKVTLDLENTNIESGFYQVLNNDQIISNLAFNYNREESDLNYIDLDSLIKDAENVTISSTVDEIFEQINNQQKINWLFKWFLAFSVLFLLIEMLILKYFKI